MAYTYFRINRDEVDKDQFYGFIRKYEMKKFNKIRNTLSEKGYYYESATTPNEDLLLIRLTKEEKELYDIITNLGFKEYIPEIIDTIKAILNAGYVKINDNKDIKYVDACLQDLVKESEELQTSAELLVDKVLYTAEQFCKTIEKWSKNHD